MFRRATSQPGGLVGAMRWPTARSFEVWAWVAFAVAVIAPAGLLPLRTYQLYLVLLLAAVLGIGASAVLLYKPIWGLCGLIASCHFLPYGSSNFNPVVVVSPVLIGLWLFQMIVLDKEFRLVRCRPIPPLLLFCAVAVLAFISGQFPWHPTDPAPMMAQLAGLAILLLSGGVFLIAVHQIRTLRQLENLTWFFLFLAAPLIAAQQIPIINDIVRSYLGSYPLQKRRRRRQGRPVRQSLIDGRI